MCNSQCVVKNYFVKIVVKKTMSSMYSYPVVLYESQESEFPMQF